MKKIVLFCFVIFGLLGFYLIISPKPILARVCDNCAKGDCCDEVCGSNQRCSGGVMNGCYCVNPPPTQRPPPTNPPPGQPTVPFPTSGGGGGDSCTNPASCPGPKECCPFFVCNTTDQNQPMNKCVPDAGCIPNKLACQNGTCQEVCGWNCVDCSGIQGQLPPNCCVNECDNVGGACTVGEEPPPPPPSDACNGGCGVGGGFTVRGGDVPNSYGFYGWYNDGTQHSFYSKADAQGRYTTILPCDVHVFGGARIDDSDKQNYTKSPSGVYAYDLGSLGSCVQNWDFTLTAPIPTPTPQKARINGGVFVDGNKNARKNGGANGDACLNGITLTLLRLPGGETADTATSGTCAASKADATNFNFGKKNNGEYAISIPDVAGYTLLPCNQFDQPSPVPGAIIGDYFYCKIASTGVARLNLWSGPNGYDYAGLNNKLTLDGVNATVWIPMVPDGSTPTTTPPETPTVTPPGGASEWLQVVGGSVYMPSIDETLPSVGGENFLKILTGQSKSKGILYTEGSAITLTNDGEAGNYMNRTQARYSNLAYAYDYFKQKLIGQATVQSGNSLSTDPSDNVYSYAGDVNVSGNVTINASGKNNVVIYLIPGNLTINGNINVNGSSVPVFIVRDDIIVSETVSSLKGVFITGEFTTSGDVSTVLAVDGAVYADSFARYRRNSSVNDPTYRFTFEPNYLLPILPYLGKSQVKWEEIAP